ncbi:hypothetical protein KKH36_00715 [Patescibacteria group bacterium]|nr:hypothetical protein [Patescibacteria group bacterium]
MGNKKKIDWEKQLRKDFQSIRKENWVQKCILEIQKDGSLSLETKEKMYVQGMNSSEIEKIALSRINMKVDLSLVVPETDIPFLPNRVLFHL